MPAVASPDSLLHLLSRIHAGFRPGPAELAGADVIENRRLMPTIGPFMLIGRVGAKDFFAVALALDAEAGWALLTDGWLRLGKGSGSFVPLAEIMRRAALWLWDDAAGAPSSFPKPVFLAGGPRDEGGPESEARRIRAEAAQLAQRAERAGLPMVAYLLDMAAMEGG